ncbi:porin [Hymenobacter sp. RP-2-7]|uniref:Porin n=1 Tax=Hymenobacter polaris TaxID=2682546 RepID=A0A7Y0FLC7_9BACT|nr:outer membrane beta-barrel protein [Hymenobacter polaris]NML64246.1 porin [Hymenobacter polaris]
MKHYLLSCSLLLLSTAVAQAQTATYPADTAKVTVYGYLDGYYGYDFPHPSSTQRPEFFYSHNRQDEFTVNQALVGLRYDNGQVHGALGLQAGTYPEANYAAEPVLLRSIYEAWAGFRPFKKAWLDIGVFGSHIGYESAISKDNWTVTHSLAAEGSPYYEAGAKLSYEISPKVTVTGLVLNGWQNIRDNNRGKALGTQLQWRPSEKWLVNSSTFFGNEQPQDSARRYRYFHDLYVVYMPDARWSVLALFDIGTQQRARPDAPNTPWHTGQLVVRRQLGTRWHVAARAEYYYAEYGVVVRFLAPTPAQRNFNVRGASLNFDYAPSRHVLVRLEGKFLNSKNPRFDNDSGSRTTNYGNLTSTVALSF